MPVTSGPAGTGPGLKEVNREALRVNWVFESHPQLRAVQFIFNQSFPTTSTIPSSPSTRLVHPFKVKKASVM